MIFPLLRNIHKTASVAAFTLLFPVMQCMAGNGSFPDSVPPPQGAPLVLPCEPVFPGDPVVEPDYSAILDVIIGSEGVVADSAALADVSLRQPAAADADAGRYSVLTEEDYRRVAAELGVETAAIKAVVEIEAGPAHKGFWEPGKPLINFDLAMFRKFAPRHGVSLKKARKSHPEVFARPDVRRYGSYQGGQYARLEGACEIDRELALKSAFWGMFQIGGFNWAKCGAADIEEFVALMSRSERDQLELFAQFIRHGGMVEAIRKKNWLKFALRYNGPKAKSRGYHKRLASAYKRHKKREQEMEAQEAAGSRTEASESKEQ